MTGSDQRVAKYLGVHGDHVITRVAGLDPDLAAAFRQGWVDGTPRVDLVDDSVLDTFAVVGSVEDAGEALTRFAMSGLDVAVIMDDPQVDAETHLRAARQVHEQARARPAADQ